MLHVCRQLLQIPGSEAPHLHLHQHTVLIILCQNLFLNCIPINQHTIRMPSLPRMLREDFTVATPVGTILLSCCILDRSSDQDKHCDLLLFAEIAPRAHTLSGTVHPPYHPSRFIFPRHRQRCGPTFFASQPSRILQLGSHPCQPLSIKRIIALWVAGFIG